ncbi:MAG: transcriptional regulator [Xenococcaceae cyanobacterium MO_188.B29]|nr:transcriptional regulator [Xenococcaceae cyanobacterium MO_188.B29]
MTLTINPETYGKLLIQYLPKVITNETENERALDIAETLSNKYDITPEEELLLDLLVTLIENFESKQYTFENNSTPLSRLHFLVEANNFKQADLLDIFGSKSIASEVFNGKRQISKTHAIKLGERFNVDPALFLI